MAIKSEFSSELIHVPETWCVETITVKITFSQFNICVCFVYIPSGCSKLTNELYENAISDLLNILNLKTNDKLF